MINRGDKFAQSGSTTTGQQVGFSAIWHGDNKDYIVSLTSDSGAILRMVMRPTDTGQWSRVGYDVLDGDMTFTMNMLAGIEYAVEVVAPGTAPSTLYIRPYIENSRAEYSDGFPDPVAAGRTAPSQVTILENGIFISTTDPTGQLVAAGKVRAFFGEDDYIDDGAGRWRLVEKVALNAIPRYEYTRDVSGAQPQSVGWIAAMPPITAELHSRCLVIDIGGMAANGPTSGVFWLVNIGASRQWRPINENL